jgi:hypothetical protein
MRFIKIFVTFLFILCITPVFAGNPAIFSGNDALLLKPGIDLNRVSKILTGSFDPSVTAVNAPSGSLYLSTSTARLYIKQDSGLSTNWTNTLSPSTGWSLSGNTATDPTTQFLGTTDSKDLVFRTNNAERFRITSAGVLDTTLSTGLIHSDASGILTSSLLVDADVSATAAIARTKIASGTANHVVINDGSGNLSSEAQLALSRGGTNKNITPVNGSVVYSDADSFELSNAGSNGQFLGFSGGIPAWLAQSSIDHGSLGGLTDDDHTQYALLAGRSGGQTLTGGTAASNKLILRSSSNGTKGQVQLDETTASTSPTTGALRVDGGVGIGGEVYTASDVFVGDTLNVTNDADIDGQVNAIGFLNSLAGLQLQDPGAGSNQIRIQSPTLAANYTLTLPIDDGTLGQIPFNSDGNASLAWSAVTVTSGGTLTAPSYIKTGSSIVLEDPGAGVNVVSIQAPTLANPYILTLPTDDGNSGQFLQTNGSGVLTWAAASASNPAYTSKTANYTLTGSDYTVDFDATSGALTATLPAAGSSTGKEYVIRKTDSTFNTVTIGSIDGVSRKLTTKGDTVRIQDNGTIYVLLSHTYPDTPNLTGVTISGCGTISSDTIAWTRSGSKMQIKGTFSCTTAAGVSFAVNLPSGLTFDSASMPAYVNQPAFGVLHMLTSAAGDVPSTARGPFPLFTDGSNTNQLFVTNNTNSSYQFIKRDASNIFGSGFILTFNAEVFIQDWW